MAKNIGERTNDAIETGKLNSRINTEKAAAAEGLKKDGFVYEDFYDFGMSEGDMLAVPGWWATNGEIYISLSYYDGVVTIDHVNELPDLESYFN